MNAWRSALAVSLLCLLGGCNQRPAEAVAKDPAPQAQTKEPPVAGFSGFSTEEPPTPTATAPPKPVEEVDKVPLFENPETRQAVTDYTQAFRDVKAFQAPALGDPVANPESVTAGLNELGARLDRLSAAKQRIESTLQPGEQTRWKALRKSIEQPEE